MRHTPVDVVLSDGGTVHVRAIEPADDERLREFHSRLSPESIYLRFFSPKPRLTPKEVARFTNVDHDDREALVAVLGDDLIGVARYDKWPGPDEAEAAFVVDDAHQGRGVATVLLEHLAVLARGRGIRRFTAEVLPQNRPMLGVFSAVGFAIERTFEGGVVDVLLDLEEPASVTDTIEAREQRAESRSIARVLSARSIAVIGASSHPGTVGYEIFRLIVSRGFTGTVSPVNPSARQVAGVATVPTVADLEGDVQLGIIAVPAAAVRTAVEDCVAKRVRAVIVVSEGVTADERRALVDYARRHGVRLLGPASMGLVRVEGASTLHATFAAVPVKGGPVGISSQSGPLGLAMLDQADRLGLGVSTFVSLGDRGDLSGNDFLQFWYDDPVTEVVLMYTETFGNPRKFARVARRFSLRKPIVAVKTGGDRDATDALYEQAGVIRVSTVNEMFDIGRVLATQPRPRGPRVAIVTNATSPAALARAGFAAAGLVEAAVVDLGHRAGAADFGGALDRVLNVADVDAVLVIDAPPLLASVDAVAAIVEATASRGHKPVVAVSLGRGAGPLAPGGRVPTFSFPEPAVAALGRACRYEAWRRGDHGHALSFTDLDLARVKALVAIALTARPSGTLLPVVTMGELLGAAGIPFAAARTVATRQALLEAADELGYPVALKALGLSRPARSESSGVALDLQNLAEVDAAFERMSVALGPQAVAEVCVQQMAPGGVETRVMLATHAIFGPVVRFGLGGAFADAIDDQVSRALPLTDVDARQIVVSSRAAAVIETPDAVTDVVARVAALAEAVPEIIRLDLNPVLVSSHGAWTVGASVHVAPADAAAPFPVRGL